jgi:hypothetical protein
MKGIWPLLQNPYVKLNPKGFVHFINTDTTHFQKLIYRVKVLFH